MADPSTGPLILFVTTDPLIRQEATYGFPSDVRVELAGDSRQAMAAMKDLVPTVVVMDIQTGSAGGYGLARDMSQWAALRDIPICMLIERSQDTWLAKEAGASAIRVKPIDAAALTADVLELVPNRV